ncbi:hypothetical protein [Actinoalloteichus hymeniacidonis]|uniref:Uncharacterized protein n=1 Tax=Actinoalloteichus hymeniacidonis TaxID=340345 RepID=A0AAC9HPL9_9PSEU|nr:hypothetical protein [Actinoalloteichus hymeniacidonis]AOS63157.1 hypothetical protein TL08_11715 [Actinoalloteichus hymeniacidonis]
MSDLHATAPFQLLDDSDRRVATGELSPGRAVSAVDAELDSALDPEIVPRRPTFCEMTLAVIAPPASAYRLAVADREPVELTSAGDGQWIASLP